MTQGLTGPVICFQYAAQLLYRLVVFQNVNVLACLVDYVVPDLGVTGRSETILKCCLKNQETLPGLAAACIFLLAALAVVDQYFKKMMAR